MVAGIYCIKNLLNNNMYIGQSIDIERRLKEHQSRLLNNKHKNKHLQNSFNKNGLNNFSCQILATFNKDTPFIQEILNDSEKYFISSYKTFTLKNHYNKNSGGKNYKLSEESKEKIRKSQLGKNNSMYNKTPWNKNKKGVYSEETRKKMGAKNIRKECSDETRRKKSLKLNSSGYRNVYRKKCKTCKQGFRYVYQYTINNETIFISSINIKDLEKKVKERKLPWECYNE